MASEDVLHRYAAMLLSGGSSRQDDADLMGALAAELRELRSLLSVSESGRKAERNLRLNAEEECGELRRDKARLDWLGSERRSFKRYSSGIAFYVYGSTSISVGCGTTLREAIDAAMTNKERDGGQK